MNLADQLQEAAEPLVEIDLAGLMAKMDDADDDARAMADKSFEKQVRQGEVKIAKALKATAQSYLKLLRKASGKRWRARITADLVSFTSVDGKQAVDLYWDYDPMRNTADITVEGPKRKIRVFRHQSMNQIGSSGSALEYLWWLADALQESEDIREAIRTMVR